MGSHAGGKTKVPRVGCVALPLFQRSTEAATTTTQSGSSVSDANTATSTASSAVPRRLCVWRDHTSKKGSSSAMLASVARGDMVAMLLLRAASPQWVNHPDGSNLHSHLNGTSSSGATAEGSSGRYEIPSWPIGNGGAPLAGANTEPSRKTLVFLDPTTSSGSNDNVRNAAPHRAVFALARVSGERDTFAVTFAAPLSPLHAFAAACVAIGSNAKGADVALAGAPWPTGASGSASAHSSNMTGTTSSSNSSNVMSTPRGAAMAALGAAGLVLPQRKVLPPLAAGSAVPPPAAAPPEAPQTPGKGPGVAEEGEAASMDSPATAHSRQELLQQHQRGSEHHEANERGSEAAAVEVVARGRVIKRRSISQLRDSRDGSHDSSNGSAGYNGPLLGSPGHYPQGSLAAKLMPFSPMAAAASHIAESALTAGLDYFTDMPLGYPPTNDLPAMADSTNYEDTDRSARGSAGKHGDSQFRSSYRHDDDDDGKAWHEEGPEPRLGDELYGGADDDDEEEGGIHSGRVSSSMQLDAHAPRLTQGGDSPSSIGAASRSTSGPWTDESNLRRNNNGDEDAHRLKQAARWYGFQFLCKSGWQHENAQVCTNVNVGLFPYFTKIYASILIRLYFISQLALVCSRITYVFNASSLLLDFYFGVTVERCRGGWECGLFWPSHGGGALPLWPHVSTGPRYYLVLSPCLRRQQSLSKRRNMVHFVFQDSSTTPFNELTMETISQAAVLNETFSNLTFFCSFNAVIFSCFSFGGAIARCYFCAVEIGATKSQFCLTLKPRVTRTKKPNWSWLRSMP